MRHVRCSCVLASALLLLSSHAALAQKPAAPASAAPPASYEELYQRYLAAARATPAPAPGTSFAWLSGLMADPRAHAVNDIVTVRVVESITGAGTADSSLDKKGSGSASVSHLFGVEGKLPKSIDPTALAALDHQTAFKGGGSTTRTGELTATMTARVAEVLPNGDLVLEGVREIDINGDRQIVVLTGVVRPADISSNNIVLSTQVGQLGIRYFGQGLMKDNLKPGWLIRILNKIF